MLITIFYLSCIKLFSWKLLDLKSLNNLPFQKIVEYIISWYAISIATVTEQQFSDVLNDKGELDETNLPIILWSALKTSKKFYNYVNFTLI